MSPTLLRADGYRFYFYSRETREPPHIHVQRGEAEAKFWLNPVRLATSDGFTTRQLTRIERSCARTAPSSSAPGRRTSVTTPTNISPGAELALRATHVELDAEAITARLEDGRTVRVPFTWFPRLAAATPGERARWQLTGRGTGIHWPLLDEDVSVFSLVHPELTVAARTPAGDVPTARRRAS